jgi:hypothetical protein
VDHELQHFIFHKGISSAATQTDAERLCSSAVTGNTSVTCSSGATQSGRAVRGDATWPKYTSGLRLRGRSAVAENVRVGYIRARSAVTR